MLVRFEAIAVVGARFNAWLKMLPAHAPSGSGGVSCPMNSILDNSFHKKNQRFFQVGWSSNEVFRLLQVVENWVII